jgi:hypothetical protein
VLLKNRAVAQTEDMLLWYSRAFGPLRNMMNISVDFSFDKVKDGVKTHAKFFCELTYTMFPEVQEEYPELHFEQKELIELRPNQDDDPAGKVRTFYLELQRPYGDYKAVGKMMAADEDGDGGSAENIIDLPPQLKQYFKHMCEPKPISAAEQERRDNEEEEENKKKEQQARNKQKQLDDKKAEMRIEKQAAILKQEQNSAQLKVYFRAMNLQLHKSEEDFNASMSILSIYHQELHANF